MTDRLERTRRLLAVQRKRDQLSEWRLLELLSQSAVLDERHRSLVRFLQEESAFSGIFSLSMMRRLQRLAELQAKAAIDQDTQRKLHLRDRGCLRRAERVVQVLETNETRMDAARELWDIIDSAAQRLSQGPCKVPNSPSQTTDLAGEFNGVDTPGFGYSNRSRDGSRPSEIPGGV
jgi:hypothetical protein